MKLGNFTIHAAQRLRQRTKMTAYELNSMIEKTAAVNLGSKPGINKDHYLFYSVKDEDYFVAVIDSLFGSIITVWLLEYHENLGWPVSEREKLIAKELAEAYASQEREKTKASVYWISVGYLNESNEQKVTSICKVPIESFECDPIWSFANKEETVEFLTQKFLEKVGEAYPLLWVSFKLGKNGTITAIGLN